MKPSKKFDLTPSDNLRAQDPLELFHALVAQERYREARGILETEDLPPQTVEKWLAWLDALHYEERLLHGVASDKKAAAHPQSLRRLLHVTLTMLVGVVLAVPVWQIVGIVFTYESTSPIHGGIFLFAGMVLGFLGWRDLAGWLSPDNGLLIGAFVMLGLLGITLTSGMPTWFYYEPPVHYLLVGFALLFPYPVVMCSKLIGWGLERLILHTPSKK
jgi:hypothetical protein